MRHSAVEPPLPGCVVLVQEPEAHDNTTTRYHLKKALQRKKEEEEAEKKEEEEELLAIPLQLRTPAQWARLRELISASSQGRRKRKKKRKKRLPRSSSIARAQPRAHGAGDVRDVPRVRCVRFLPGCFATLPWDTRRASRWTSFREMGLKEMGQEGDGTKGDGAKGKGHRERGHRERGHRERGQTEREAKGERGKADTRSSPGSRSRTAPTAGGSPRSSLGSFVPSSPSPSTLTSPRLSRSNTGAKTLPYHARKRCA